jgi:hypothetical protein
MNTTMNTKIDDQIEHLESLFGECQATNENPCGACVYYDEDEETDLPDDSGKPWRVHYCDGCPDDSFRSFSEAENAIVAYMEKYG